MIVTAEAYRYPSNKRWIAGVATRYCTTPVSINPHLAGLKTLCRLEQVLARQEWTGGEVAEGLMLNPDGQVIGGTRSNVFAVLGGKVVTPSLERSGVLGVMRKRVMQACVEAGISISEAVLLPSEVTRADELFLTNSQFGIWPIRQLEDSQLSIGDTTRRLMDQLARSGVQECAVF